TDGYPNGYGYAQNDEYLNYSWNNIATYTNNWGAHNLKVQGGITLERNVEHFFDVGGNTFPNDQFRTLNSAANITSGSGFITSYAFQNNLLRVDYSYKDRYLVSLTGSYNGSSRFGSNNRYGFFPAASVGWIMTEESFMKRFQWINFLKIRGSYGITGNGNINNFQALGLVGSGADYNGIPGLHPTQLSNSDLKWEKTGQLDLGLDFHLLNSRIRGTFDYYNKKTKDLLLSVPVPSTNGFRNYIKNIGKLENYGFEFSLEGDLITGKDFRFSLNGNIATLVNKVTKLPNGKDIVNGENLIREGQPLGVFYLQQYAGVNPDNGDALYYVNATPTQDQIDQGTVFKISKFGDRYVTANYNAATRVTSGSPFPDFYGGFGTSVFYKGVQLNVNFQYQYGNKIFWFDGRYLETNMGSLFNQDKTQLNYWTPDNKNATVPEPRALTNNGSSSSTRYLEDGTYLRLKSVILSYTLPRSLTGDYKIRLYSQGYNLLTFTGFNGLDPEITPNQGNAQQGNVFFQPPQQRTITFGIDLGF
ncbi:MAG TPA: SusC/RagA family TonB-linked outer membrane protein, partial [Balneolales bacterium]|nr:SusC/RagA family TonB-linked outer membrane protein [Balneolales bacterium]